MREILNIPGVKHKPAVLQNESHPYLQERDLRDYCRIHGIVFQVWGLFNEVFYSVCLV